LPRTFSWNRLTRAMGIVARIPRPQRDVATGHRPLAPFGEVPRSQLWPSLAKLEAAGPEAKEMAMRSLWDTAQPLALAV
jgi:hypothetical protein